MTIRAYPLQSLGISAAQERMDRDAGTGVGVIDIGGLKVTAGSGLNSNIAAGRANIRNNQGGVETGMYRFWNDVATTVTHTAGDGSNPRIDSIYAKIVDATIQGGGTNAGQIVIVAGTATVGATLDNRTGAGSAPANSILLADVLVPTAAGSAASFTYRDRRPYGSFGIVPPIKTLTHEAVLPEPVDGALGTAGLGTTFNNYQIATLVHVPSRITATRIRWTYVQQGTALTGNYNLAIYDASGRKIVETGSVAIAGAAGSVQQRSETIASTLLEPGLYYCFVGWASLATGSIAFRNILCGNQGAFAYAVTPNSTLYASSGGITAPTTLLGLTDAAVGATGVALGVPAFALATA